MPKPISLLMALTALCVVPESAMAAVSSPQEASAPPAGLVSYLSYPFIGELCASKDGKRMAWVETHKGVRNVWMASGPDFTPRQVTHATEDDGQQLTGLRFSPDGHTLVWGRGGGEAAGWTGGHLPPPDPASSTTAPQLEIWSSRDGGTPVRIAVGGTGPVVSSKGDVAFVKDGDIWTVPADGSSAAHRLFYDRWHDADPKWSPDGTRLAFVTLRGDHSFVGVYQGADKPLTWMAPQTAYDADPVWSPDGTQIAFSRQFGQASYLNLPLVEKPNPFSLWVGSAADGSAHKIWQSPATLNGSYPLIAGGFYLKWAAGDRLTFRAEMDGYAHLYSLSVKGGEPLLLTPGRFMDEDIVLSPDGRTLYYSGNDGKSVGDIDRRHLFRVPVDKAAPQQLTSGTGLEWTPVPLGDKLGWISSTATTPMHVALGDSNGTHSKALVSVPSDYAKNSLVVPTPVSFKAADGTLIHGQLFEPKGGGKHPALVFVHGGPGRQMFLGWSYVDYYTHSYAMNQYFVNQGFVVLSVNYRMGIGYGRAFQHPAHAGVAGNSEYQDVVAGAHYLQALHSVDPARLGIWGGSYGGLLTAQALARNSDIFKAGVDFHGVHDWSLWPGIADGPRRYEQGNLKERFRIAFESSPEAALSGWTSPVLLIAGDDDRNVPFDQTVDLANKLRAQGTPFQELILPDEVHGFLRYHSWLKADSAMVRFLDAQLKP